jgi:hypothetical protein
MTVLYVTLPIMALAVAIAVVPVLRSSASHNRALREGQLETAGSAKHEADFWHRVLGRMTKDAAETPGLVNDDELIRVGVDPAQLVEQKDGPSVWDPRP